MQKRPEFVLRSHTAVVTAMSDKFNPTIYLGGSASGCVLIWDTRAKVRNGWFAQICGRCIITLEFVTMRHVYIDLNRATGETL